MTENKESTYDNLEYKPPTLPAFRKQSFSKVVLLSYIFWFTFIFVPLTFKVATYSADSDISLVWIMLWVLFAVLPLVDLIKNLLPSRVEREFGHCRPPWD